MSGHTPGPWKQISSNGWDAVADSGNMIIARLVYNNSPNATLIAAAPDLAEALRDLQKAFRDCIGSAAFWEFEQSNPAVRAAQRALAKAGL